MSYAMMNILSAYMKSLTGFTVDISLMVTCVYLRVEVQTIRAVFPVWNAIRTVVELSTLLQIRKEPINTLSCRSPRAPELCA